MSLNRSVVFAALFVAAGLGGPCLLAGCGQDNSTKVVEENDVTKQKMADMQKAMMGNMKGTKAEKK